MTHPTNSRLRAFRQLVSERGGDGSAADVAEAVGVAPTTITRIELGERSPNLDTAMRILAWCDRAAKAHRIPKVSRVQPEDLLPPE